MRKRICAATGCCRLVDADSGNKYCEEHQNLEARDREAALQGRFYMMKHYYQDLYNSPKWKAMRKVQLSEHPLCELCGEAATEVHHVVAHQGNPELFYDSNNLMSVCRKCHNAITAKETADKLAKSRQQKELRKLWY